ncbi:MAG TPA: zinc ribbon domain-containing protein [Candidatus Faecousia intestinigallinarum]|nr:zinc ribbon domain-containing protein [Candidatus Faecousia intestinigallinarum]
MKFCPKCGAQMDDAAAFCPNCGAPASGQPDAEYTQPSYSESPKANPYDHTSEFDPADISEHKTLCMLPYLLGTIGIICTLLSRKDSKYVEFHLRQALKLEVVTVLLGVLGGALAICSKLLSWSWVVPILSGIVHVVLGACSAAVLVCLIIVFILKIICFFQICAGKAKEPAIIHSLGFLK